MSGAANDPVAIVGVGCRLPGGIDSLASLWQRLEAGRPVIGRMPPGRFAVDRFVDAATIADRASHIGQRSSRAGRMVTAEGGFLEHIDRFDAEFFGISPREALKIDPQHRLLLELSWEALEDGAIVPSSLAGSRTGVYLGLWSNEYESVMSRQVEDVDLYTTTGGGRYAASGRISFVLDLRGPSLTLDTGCSSSLVAFHLACQALRNGDAECAIVGAANLILQPYISVGYSRSGMLSTAARCRFGAASPDGYVRSEGAVVVVLKPLSAALCDGNPVHAVVLGSCVNADGGGSGLLVAPSQAGQADMLRTAWARAGVDPGRVAYVEAHGTGTAAGDAVELRALGSVLGRRNGRGPLPVGSVKTVIGHTEAVAGLAGLLKALLVLRHRRVPADPVDGRNPEIPWDELGVTVVREPVELTGPLVAGVNSFGVTGTNAHVVLGAETDWGAGAETDRGAAALAGPRVVVLSGRTVGALGEGARRLRESLSEGALSTVRGSANGGALRDLSCTTTCRREHHPHRLAVVADSLGEVRVALDEYLAGETSGRMAVGEAGAPRVGFVFSGQGSQWVGMGRELLARAPVFAAAVDACEAELRPLVGWSLRDVLAGQVALDRVDVIQPTLTALQIALARLLESWGIRPAAVVGHSMGEVAAAHIGGAITLAEAMRVIALRSRLLAEIAGQGAMALVDLPAAEVAARLESGRVSIAAVNGPRSTVLSGDPAEIDALLARFEAEDVFCRRVNVDVASHSAQTDPLLPRLREGLGSLQPKIPEIPFHSAVYVGEARPLNADYWADNLRLPVRFAAAVQGMIEAVDHVVEIASHPILLASIADSVADAGTTILPTLRRDEPELRRLLELVTRLHVAGLPVDWRALADPSARAIPLPAYPWQRESYWLERWDDWSGDRVDAEEERPPELLDSVLYRVEWQPAESGGAPRARRDSPIAHAGELPGTWLLLESGEAELDAAVAAALRGCGAKVTTATDDSALAIGHAATHDVAGVVDLRAVAVVVEGGAAEFDAAIETECRGALELVQALTRRGARPEFGVWWVTRGAQGPAPRAPAESAVAQAALWGLVRTLWEEEPALQPHLVDLEPGTTAPVAAAQILATIIAYGAEPQVAFAHGRAQVARLVRLRAPAQPARWRADVSYLLTGGLGDIGLAVAEEMVRGGARRLVLLSRTPLPPRNRWGDALLDDSTARRIKGVLQLERLGASVLCFALDVADEAALARMLTEYRAEHFPPIAGVIHLAGELDNHLVRESTAQAFATSVRGKATGAWNLHRLLPDAQHSYFSSIVPVLPQSGQANYAAANAVLDALACARRAAGSSAISLAWAVWENTGLVRDAQVARFVDYMKLNGLESIARDDGATLFRWTAALDAPHVVIAPIDWARAANRIARQPGAAFYHELIETVETQLSRGVSTDRDLTPAQRRTRVIERVRAIAAAVLRLPSSALPLTQPLGRRGLDSLMAMELRNRLETEFDLQLAVSVIWNYPTVEALASYVLACGDGANEWGVGAGAGAEIQGGDSEGIAEVVAGIANASEDDVLRMLQEAR